MFVVLDTNRFQVLVDETPMSSGLEQRLKEREAVAFTTLITVQEVWGVR